MLKGLRACNLHGHYMHVAWHVHGMHKICLLWDISRYMYVPCMLLCLCVLLVRLYAWFCSCYMHASVQPFSWATCTCIYCKVISICHLTHEMHCWQFPVLSWPHHCSLLDYIEGASTTFAESINSQWTGNLCQLWQSYMCIRRVWHFFGFPFSNCAL